MWPYRKKTILIGVVTTRTLQKSTPGYSEVSTTIFSHCLKDSSHQHNQWVAVLLLHIHLLRSWSIADWSIERLLSLTETEMCAYDNGSANYNLFMFNIVLSLLINCKVRNRMLLISGGLKNTNFEYCSAVHFLSRWLQIQHRAYANSALSWIVLWSTPSWKGVYKEKTKLLSNSATGYCVVVIVTCWFFQYENNTGNNVLAYYVCDAIFSWIALSPLGSLKCQCPGGHQIVPVRQYTSNKNVHLYRSSTLR